MTASGCLERTRAIANTLEANAERAERERTLPAESVRALAEAGVFRLCLPREVGGAEADLLESIEVWEEIARADGSTGWTAMANGSGAGAAAAYLSDDAVEKIFGSGAAATVGGQFAPRGTAAAADGGWRVRGSYSFGSGTGHSGFVSAGFIPLENGAPRLAPSGLPDMRVGFVPRAQVAFRDNWHVMGLCGTGSYDYEVEDVVVPEGFSFPLFTREPKRGSAIFRLGMMPLTAAGHAAFALGVGRRALDEIRAIAGERQRMGDPTPLAGRLTFQVGYARAESRLRAARGYVMETFGAAQEIAQRGDPISLAARADLRAATNLATEAARDACDFAHERAGTVAIRDGSPLHRCFRDIHTGTQHAFISERIWSEVAQAWLGSVEEVIGL